MSEEPSQYPLLLNVLEFMKGLNVDTQSRIRVIILGGGKGGTALLDLLFHLPHIHIVGIADTNPFAPGLEKAKQLRIPSSDSER